MFPPFRIRNLHGDDAGLVKILPSDYDKAIAEAPAARLTYIDDDDGETITVGSAFELGERLQEPAPPSRYSYKDTDLKEHAVHIFDIDRSDVVVAKWQSLAVHPANDFQARRATLHEQLAEARLKFESYKWTNQHATGQSGLPRGEDNRNLSFKACRPPQVTEAKEEGQDGFTNRYSSRSSTSSLPTSQPKSQLTWEGHRQAVADGNRLKWQLSSFENKGNFMAKPGFVENRWASYRSAKPWQTQVPNVESIPTIPAAANKVTEQDSFSPSFQLYNGKTGSKKSATDARQSTENVRSQPRSDSETDTESFLEAFEAELAQHLSKTPGASDLVDSATSHSTATSTSGAQASATVTSPQGVDALTLKAIGAFANVVGGIGLELTRRIPGLHTKATGLEYNVSEFVDKAVTEAIRCSDNHAKSLSNVLHHASEASLYAAGRTRQADVKVVKDLLTSLTNVVGEVGKSVWTRLEDEVATTGSASQSQSTAVDKSNDRDKPSCSAATTTTSGQTSQPQAGGGLSCSRDDCLPKDVSRPIVFKDQKHLARHNYFYHPDMLPPVTTNFKPRDFQPLEMNLMNMADGARPPWSTVRAPRPSDGKHPGSVNRVAETIVNEKEKTASVTELRPNHFNPRPPYASYWSQDSNSCPFERQRPKSFAPGSSLDLFPSPSFSEERLPRTKYEKQTHPLRSAASVPAFNGPILDQEDADPEFSARYPSLMSNKGLEPTRERARTQLESSSYLQDMIPEKEIARYPPVSEIDPSILGLRSSSHRAIEAKHLPVSHHPYPSRSKPWVTRPSPQELPQRWSLFADIPKQPSMKESNVFQQVPGAWPELATEPSKSKLSESMKPAEESSGAFFERMTGRRATALDDSMIDDKIESETSNLRRAHTTAGSINRTRHTTADFNARLAGSFNPFTDAAQSFGPADRHATDEENEKFKMWSGQTANHHREQTRRAPVSMDPNAQETLWSQSAFHNYKPLAPPFTGSRRPSSIHVTGAGRNGYLNRPIAPGLRSTAPRLRPRPHSLIDINTRSSRSQHASRHSPLNPPPPPKLAPIEISAPPLYAPIPVLSTRPSLPILPSSTSISDHHATHGGSSINSGFSNINTTPSTRSLRPNNKIDICIQHLRELGYSTKENRDPSVHNPIEDPGSEWLRIYAEAADGDVGEAIEMMEDEKKAWNTIAGARH